MRVGQCCTRDVVVAGDGDGIEYVARLMREHHVGDVVVVHHQGEGARPVGIITDRDLVIEVIAAGVDPKQLTAGDVSAGGIHTASESEDLDRTLERMCELGVRRLPVVDDFGMLVGILTLDDLLDLTAETLEKMARLVDREVRRETRQRR